MSDPKPRDDDQPAAAQGDSAATDRTVAAAAEPSPFRRRASLRSPRQVLQPEAAPPPPARSQKARHPVVVVLNFFLMLAVLVVLGGGAAFYFGKLRFTQPGPLKEPSSVAVPSGADLSAIVAQLQRQNVIDSPFLFATAVRLSKAQNQLKAGEYLFQPGVSMEQVLDDLVSGRSVLHGITLPEGLTSQQIVARLNADSVLSGSIAEIPPEGSLMPDTYKFTRGATRQQIVDQMKRAASRAVAETWSRRTPNLPIKSAEQLVILASIVEKETGKADERPRVAAVFLNRLRAGMRLQSDPTVIYGLFGGAGKPPDRPILQSDLDKPTPYNSYQNNGLPPTPIANPGRAALEAVANPSSTNELYFVADGTGGHAFAATIEEHNRNVARWRKVEAARQQAAKADASATKQPSDAQPASPGSDAPPASNAAAPGADQQSGKSDEGEAGAAKP